MILPGTIVEYVEQGRFICGVVVEHNQKRLRLYNQNGRELNLPEGRVVHHDRKPLSAGLSRDQQRQRLQETDQQRRALMAEVAVEEVWQLAAAEGDTLFAPEFLAELSFGGPADDDRVAAWLRCVFEDRLYFKYKDGRIMAHPVEVVEQLRAKLERERERQALLERGAARLKTLFAQGPGGEEWPEQELCLGLLRDFYLHGNEAEESELARELLKAAGLTRPHDVYELLVKVGRWRPDENLPLLRAALPTDFSPEVLAEAAAIAPPTAEELLAAGRRDLRHLPLLTIDGAATRDLDDALHVERLGEHYRVGIHIADVAWFVKPGSRLFDCARERVTSIYFDDAQIPMLPPVLSEGLCSLVAGEVRPAMSFLVTLRESGEIIDSEVVASLVTVQRRLTYEAAAGLLESDPDLKALLALARALRRRRLEADAVILPIPDVNVRIDADGQPSISLEDVDQPARLLVAEMMVLANMVGADLVAARQAPGLFRAQDEPHQRLVYGDEKDLFTIWRQRKQLKPGQLLTSPRRHSGVGAAAYTTLTSPIRRLLDLVMQHQLYHLRRSGGSGFAESEMLDFIAAINTTQTKVNQTRRERHRYWLLKYLAAGKERIEALVTARGPRRVSVVLLDCLLEADLPPTRGINVQPGEVVRLKISRVEPLDGILRLEW